MPIGTDGGPAPYHVQPIFTSGGGVFLVQNPDGSYDTKQMEMGSQGSINAMTKIGQMGAAGLLKTSIGADNVATLFTDQKAAFMVSGPWNLPAVTKSGVKYAISDLPKFADGTEAQPFIGAQNLYVAAKGKNKALAQEYATNFFIQPEVAKALYDVQPRPPALQSVYNEVAASTPDIKAFGEAGVNGQPLPSIPQMASHFRPMGQGSGEHRRRSRPDDDHPATGHHDQWNPRQQLMLGTRSGGRPLRVPSPICARPSGLSAGGPHPDRHRSQCVATRGQGDQRGSTGPERS